MDKKCRIMCAWGGTGWHVFPVKSLIDYMRTTQGVNTCIGRIYRCGTRGSLEERLAMSMRSDDVHFVPIKSWKFRRQWDLISIIKNIIDLVLFVWWTIQSYFFLSKHQIDVVFCKWGYAALPMVIAAAYKKIPIIVHESDTKPGLVNRIAHRFASTTFTWFDGVLDPSITVWQILSCDLLHPDSDFNPVPADKINKTIVALTWWSQWSRTLLHCLDDIISHYPDHNMYYIVVGGTQNNYYADRDNVRFFSFVSQKQMARIYELSDCVITRAWTTSLAEQKLFWVRSLIVPLPVTHDQYSNAHFYHKHYGDIIIDQTKPWRKKTLERHLIDCCGYKKNLTKPTYDQITKAHQAITQAILQKAF